MARTCDTAHEKPGIRPGPAQHRGRAAASREAADRGDDAAEDGESVREPRANAADETGDDRRKARGELLELVVRALGLAGDADEEAAMDESVGDCAAAVVRSDTPSGNE